jgi:hypothetical protein
MSNIESDLDFKEVFLEKFQKLSLKVEQLTDEISKMNNKLNKSNQMNRTFGLKALRNSEPLNFTQDIKGIGSPSKLYVLSMRAITEQWQGRKNDILITISQKERETGQDQKSLGIRIPINDIKSLRDLSKEIISILYIACELKGIEINEILRDLIGEVNKNGYAMLSEIKQKMVFK